MFCKVSVTPRTLLSTAVCVFGLSAPCVQADESPVADAPAAVSVQGYVDASYSHFDFDPMFANGGVARVFDTTKGFKLNQAALNVAYQPKEGWGYVINLVAGKDADVFAPYSINPGADHHFDYPQAFVQYATGPVTVMAGRFVTLAGAETIDPRTDANFSRSILFGYAIPFAHTGVRATVAANDTLNLIVGVNNGWDDLRPTTGGKTLEAALAYTPSKAFNVTAQSYIGDARISGLTDQGNIGTRSLVDVVATWTLSEHATVQFNGDWGSQTGLAGSGLIAGNSNSAQWHGVAGYFNYQVDDHWRYSLRGEYLDDIDGYRTGLPQMWKEATLTVGYSPVKPVELRFEIRHDYSNAPAFLNSAAMQNGQFTDFNKGFGSLALETIVKFGN